MLHLIGLDGIDDYIFVTRTISQIDLTVLTLAIFSHEICVRMTFYVG